VRVRARIEGDRWQITVSDQGPGVPDKERDSIFEPRVRVGADAAEPTGEGLGLAFCKLAATAWGGSIRVEAAAGGGARFVIEGPVNGTAG
ncbi:MAG: ATP-binding protein, partial [Alphaproteobacteria bacterium]|nr:ATP-binding protein [Alphaproteobacteria bacterium]